MYEQIQKILEFANSIAPIGKFTFDGFNLVIQIVEPPVNEVHPTNIHQESQMG